jgi:hypothetical protein
MSWTVRFQRLLRLGHYRELILGSIRKPKIYSWNRQAAYVDVAEWGSPIGTASFNTAEHIMTYHRTTSGARWTG